MPGVGQDVAADLTKFRTTALATQLGRLGDERYTASTPLPTAVLHTCCGLAMRQSLLHENCTGRLQRRLRPLRRRRGAHLHLGSRQLPRTYSLQARQRR